MGTEGGTLSPAIDEVTDMKHRIVFTLVADVEFDEQGQIQIESANWVGVDPSLAETVIQRVLIEREVQERLKAIRDEDKPVDSDSSPGEPPTLVEPVEGSEPGEPDEDRPIMPAIIERPQESGKEEAW